MCLLLGGAVEVTSYLLFPFVGGRLDNLKKDAEEDNKKKMEKFGEVRWHSAIGVGGQLCRCCSLLFDSPCSIILF